MKNVVIIFGYNNTRIYDIERLKYLCKETLNAEILLCKEVISNKDMEITPYTLETDLEIRDVNLINKIIQEIDKYLEINNLAPLACLPFSDKGVPLGSYYGKSRGLVHDGCESSLACIDKYTFRCLEKNEETPIWYKKPFFERVFSYEAAEIIVREKNVPLFFKPTSEGNSRGCIEINTLEDLENNKDILNLYFDQGVIVEECIKGCDEYSFDGVNGAYIVAEKKTSQGYYRVETQHIIPAPLNPVHYNRLIEAGKIVSKISGSNNGAVHNELFLNKETGDVYCVEPNRRPAGLKFWDWIKIAFPGVDNWNSWISWASRREVEHVYPGNNDFFIGCRMLQASISGKIFKVDIGEKLNIESRDEVIEIIISKKEGDSVSSTLKDNSDFLGYVVCKCKTIDDLRNLLDDIEREVNSCFEIS